MRYLFRSWRIEATEIAAWREPDVWSPRNRMTAVLLHSKWQGTDLPAKQIIYFHSDLPGLRN